MYIYKEMRCGEDLRTMRSFLMSGFCECYFYSGFSLSFKIKGELKKSDSPKWNKHSLKTHQQAVNYWQWHPILVRSVWARERKRDRTQKEIPFAACDHGLYVSPLLYRVLLICLPQIRSEQSKPLNDSVLHYITCPPLPKHTHANTHTGTLVLSANATKPLSAFTLFSEQTLVCCLWET